ncbi:MAG: FtsB family cell division protein [Solirubrobacterales bacterium]
MRRKQKVKFIVLLLIFGNICYIFISQQITMYSIGKEIKVKQQEEQLAKDKNQKLQDEIKMSKSDAYIEKLARERLGLIKEGETPVIDSKN